MINIGFLGYGTRALDALEADGRFSVKYFFAPRPRLCRDVYDAAQKYGDKLDFEIIDSKKMLAKRFSEIDDVSAFVMNACPFILNNEVLSHMDVYNIHPGDLRTNRGHHPHLWTVLLGERSTRIVLHKVTEAIDLGEVIAEEKIALTGKEDAKQVLDLAEDRIPRLADGLYNYLTGKSGVLYTVTDGLYRPFVTYKDYEINPCDDKGTIDRKIRARAMHSGAFFLFKGKRIYVNEILSSEVKGNEDGLLVKDGKVFYTKCGETTVFRLSKVTDADGDTSTKE